MEEKGSSSKMRQSAEINLEEMLKGMELLDEELDAVVIGKAEAKKFESEAGWMAIARVNTDRPFSSTAFFDNMKFIWGLAQTPKFREAGENLFIFQLFCLGDWRKVVHGGPWLFRGLGVIIEDYDGKTDPEKVELDGLYVWAQIHKVPDVYRQEPVVDQLARRIGRVKEVQLRPNLYYEGDYVRVRAKVLTAKPLTRFTPLTIEGEGTRMLVVKYEKIPFFCQICGYMGHSYEECGKGVWKEEDKKWGRWMIAQRREVDYSQPRGGRFGTRGGRGRGRGGTGHGFAPSQGQGFGATTETMAADRNTEDAKGKGKESDANCDREAEIAQNEQQQGEVDEINTSNKRLSANNTQADLAATVVHTDPEEDSQRGIIVTTEKQPAGVPPLPPVYVSPRKTNKRLKKGSDQGGSEAGAAANGSKNALSAGSHVGHRRAQ